MLNQGKTWVSFDRSTWWLVVWCLAVTGFLLGFAYASVV